MLLEAKAEVAGDGSVVDGQSATRLDLAVDMKEATPSFVMNGSSYLRPIRAYKCFQFLLVTWYISSAWFPQHKFTWTMARLNGPLLTTCLFTLSGILTDLRYQPFVISSHESKTFFWRLSNPFMFQYLYCRFIRLAPIIAFASLWALILELFHLKLGLSSAIFSLTLTSSYVNLAPLFSTFSPESTVLFHMPVLLMASALCSCWILYPSIAWKIEQTLRIVRPQYRRTMASVLLALATAAVTVLGTLTTQAIGSKDYIKTAQATTLWIGSTAQFLNPIFKLPVFFVGVLSGTLIRELGWSKVEARSLEDGRIRKYVLPYISDIFSVLTILAFPYDATRQPEKNQTSLNGFFTASKWLVTLYRPFEDQTTWVMGAQFALLPIIVGLFVMAATPYWHRSITGLLYGQDPVYSVLPGRSGLIMCCIYLQIVYSGPEWLYTGIPRGFGFFFLLFLLFTATLMVYYYLYEPLNLWMSLHTHEKILRSSGMTCQKSIDGLEYAPLSVIDSPNYDRFNLKDDKAELQVYSHLLNTKSPRSSGIFLWMRYVFLDIHWTYN